MTSELNPWGSMPWERDEQGNPLPHPTVGRSKPRSWCDGLPREPFEWESRPDPREPKPEPTGWACATHGPAHVVTLRSRAGRVYGSCTFRKLRDGCREFER